MLISVNRELRRSFGVSLKELKEEAQRRGLEVPLFKALLEEKLRERVLIRPKKFVIQEIRSSGLDNLMVVDENLGHTEAFNILGVSASITMCLWGTELIGFKENEFGKFERKGDTLGWKPFPRLDERILEILPTREFFLILTNHSLIKFLPSEGRVSAKVEAPDTATHICLYDERTVAVAGFGAKLWFFETTSIKMIAWDFLGVRVARYDVTAIKVVGKTVFIAFESLIVSWQATDGVTPKATEEQNKVLANDEDDTILAIETLPMGLICLTKSGCLSVFDLLTLERITRISLPLNRDEVLSRILVLDFNTIVVGCGNEFVYVDVENERIETKRLYTGDKHDFFEVTVSPNKECPLLWRKDFRKETEELMRDFIGVMEIPKELVEVVFNFI